MCIAFYEGMTINVLNVSCYEYASTTYCLDSSLCCLAEEFGFDDDGLVGESTLTEDLQMNNISYLEVSCLCDIDNCSLILGS